MSRPGQSLLESSKGSTGTSFPVGATVGLISNLVPGAGTSEISVTGISLKDVSHRHTIRLKNTLGCWEYVEIQSLHLFNSIHFTSTMFFYVFSLVLWCSCSHCWRDASRHTQWDSLAAVEKLDVAPGGTWMRLVKWTELVGKISKSSGWWLSHHLPLWKIWVSWGYDIPKIWKVIKFMLQTTNQSW